MAGYEAADPKNMEKKQLKGAGSKSGSNKTSKKETGLKKKRW